MTDESQAPADQKEGEALDLLISAREDIRKATERKEEVAVAIDFLKEAKDSMLAKDYDNAIALAKRQPRTL